MRQPTRNWLRGSPFFILLGLCGWVGVSALPDEGALRRHLALLAADLAWAEDVVPGLRRRIARTEQLVLRATPRSALWATASVNSM